MNGMTKWHKICVQFHAVSLQPLRGLMRHKALLGVMAIDGLWWPLMAIDGCRICRLPPCRFQDRPRRKVVKDFDFPMPSQTKEIGLNLIDTTSIATKMGYLWGMWSTCQLSKLLPNGNIGYIYIYMVYDMMYMWTKLYHPILILSEMCLKIFGDKNGFWMILIWHFIVSSIVPRCSKGCTLQCLATDCHCEGPHACQTDVTGMRPEMLCHGYPLVNEHHHGTKNLIFIA